MGKTLPFKSENVQWRTGWRWLTERAPGLVINTASRLESAGLAGEVNVSRVTASLAAQEFEFEPRGFVEIKNKDPMEMFLMRPMEKP